jgi:hypothetical protein
MTFCLHLYGPLASFVGSMSHSAIAARDTFRRSVFVKHGRPARSNLSPPYFPFACSQISRTQMAAAASGAGPAAAKDAKDCSTCGQGPDDCHRAELVEEAKTKSWARALLATIKEVETEKDHEAREAILRDMKSHILEVIRCHNAVVNRATMNKIREGAGRGKACTEEEKKKRESEVADLKDHLTCQDCHVAGSEVEGQCDTCGAPLCDGCLLYYCSACDKRWCKTCKPDYSVCSNDKCENPMKCYKCIDADDDTPFLPRCESCTALIAIQPAKKRARDDSAPTGAAKPPTKKAKTGVK